MNLNEFEDLREFEGLYRINPQGEIWSNHFNKIMSPTNEKGYLRISLTNNEGRKTYRIHRLLAIQYIPNPDNLPEIDHIDRNKLNNDLSNLRWCDRITNANNKGNCIALMTEEEQQKRIDDLREYKRVWAEKKARENGIQPKGPNVSNTNEYKNEWRRNKKMNMTDEEKEIELQKRRERYAKKEKTEEFKQKAIERAKKHNEVNKEHIKEVNSKKYIYNKQCEIFRNILL
jgi:superfamily II DNA/RNA helicase